MRSAASVEEWRWRAVPPRQEVRPHGRGGREGEEESSHDVDMKPIRALLNRPRTIRPELCKVCGEDGGGNDSVGSHCDVWMATDFVTGTVLYHDVSCVYLYVCVCVCVVSKVEAVWSGSPPDTIPQTTVCTQLRYVSNQRWGRGISSGPPCTTAAAECCDVDRPMPGASKWAAAGNWPKGRVGALGYVVYVPSMEDTYG